MKKIFRFVGFSMVLASLFALGASASLAQDPCTDVDGQNALYGEVTSNYKGPEIPKVQKAVEAAKQFLEKFGACEPAKVQVDWMRPKVPVWEKYISDKIAEGEKQALYTKFDAGFKATNWDEVYSAGKSILAKEPDNIDVILVLGSIGYDQNAKKVTKYNDDTITYAKMAIQKLNAGATSKTFGVSYKEVPAFNYQYNTKDNAEGWMNLIAGYLLYSAKDDKKGALPYLYQASMKGTETPKNPVVFETIGRYFLAETIRLRDDIKVKVAAQNASDPDDVKAKKEAEIKAEIALLNGNAERAMDGFARAYKVAKTDAATKTYRDGLYTRIKELYTVRFQKETGVDDFVASTTAKPLTDPTTAVTPIEDAEPDTTKTTSTVPAATTPSKPAGAKPGMSSVGAKPSATTTATTKTVGAAKKSVQ